MSNARVISELTPRQQIVLSHVIAGHKNDKIARLMGISIKTIETHRARINKKCKVHDSGQLFRFVLAARFQGIRNLLAVGNVAGALRMTDTTIGDFGLIDADDSPIELRPALSDRDHRAA